MTLRKTNIENSVKFTPKSGQTQEKDIEPSKIENNSLPRKQNKSISQNNNKRIKYVKRGSGFAKFK